MNRNILSVTALAATGLLLNGAALCSPAHAQSWLPDRQYTQGPGIRIGVLELHPGIAVRGGYDTNVFKADGETGPGEAGQEIVGAGILSISPHLNLSTQTAQRSNQGEDRGVGSAPPVIAFRGGLSATYFHYFQEDAPKNVDVDTDLWLGILPQRPVNLELSAAFQRSTRPFTPLPANVENNTYANDTIRPAVRLNVGSASQVLTGYAGYSTGITLYEGSDFSYLNSLAHNIDAGSAWKFLPHTALLYDAVLTLNDYSKIQLDQGLLYSDSKSFKTRLGINGALTNTLTLRVMAGYAAGFYDEDLLDEYQDVVGEVSLGLKIAQAHKLEASYTRDVQLSPLGGWLRTDRVAAGLNLMFAQAFSLRFEAGYGYVTYGRLLGPDRSNPNARVALGTDNTSNREDHRVDGAIRAEYRATDWLAFMADATIQTTITDFEYSVETAGLALPDPAGYTSFQVFGGARAHY